MVILTVLRSLYNFPCFVLLFQGPGHSDQYNKFQEARCFAIYIEIAWELLRPIRLLAQMVISTAFRLFIGVKSIAFQRYIPMGICGGPEKDQIFFLKHFCVFVFFFVFFMVYAYIYSSW